MVAGYLHRHGLEKQVVDRVYLITTNSIGFYQQLNFIQQSLKVCCFAAINQADEEIRTLDPLLGKEMLYH